MTERGSLLGIDFGTVRMGLAICDPDRIIAAPLGTYTRVSQAADAVYFMNLIEQYRPVGIVLGLPLHASGEESPMSRQARAFGAWLEKLTQIPVLFWDERYTSHAAEELLLTAELSKHQRKSRVDRVAAQMILQSFLDASAAKTITQSPN